MIKKKISFYLLSLSLFGVTFVFPPVLAADSPELDPWFKKAVLIKSYQQSYDWLTPWEKLEIRTQTGMALVVSLNSTKMKNAEADLKQNLFLLTTAEIVADATLIEATRKDMRNPFQAELVLMDYAANLALLKIENSKFWEKLIPVEWSPAKSTAKTAENDIYSLKIKSAQEWEMESGTIKQMAIGHREVSDSWLPLLKLSGVTKSGQGFPILQDNETVGIVLENSAGGAKALPASKVLEFLEHASNDSYRSLSHRGFNWRRLPQRSAADFYKIPEEKPGVWISRVLPFGTGSDVLERGDYLTKIGKWKITHDGKIKHPEWGLSLFDLLFLDQLKVGDPLELEVIRKGKLILLETKVAAYEEYGRTVPLKKVGFAPKYVIQGGFLFQELSMNYLAMWGASWHSRAPTRLRLFLSQNETVMIHEKKTNYDNLTGTKAEEFTPRVVLVTQVIPDQINIGYQKLTNAVVLKINGLQIQRLKDVSDAFSKPDSEFHLIEFLPGSNRLSVVLPVDQLKQSNRRIQNNFRIPKLQSL